MGKGNDDTPHGYSAGDRRAGRGLRYQSVDIHDVKTRFDNVDLGTKLIVTPPDKKAWCMTCSTEMVQHAVVYNKAGEWHCPGCQKTISNDAMLATHAFVSPWVPMCEPIDIKHIGKMIEEFCECGAALARSLIQGIDEVEPTTKKPNRQWLQEEIADVLANCQLVVAHFDLDKDAIRERRDRKKVRLSAWHKMLAHKPDNKVPFSDAAKIRAAEMGVDLDDGYTPSKVERHAVMYGNPTGTPPSTDDDFGDPDMPVSKPAPRRKRNATQKRNKRKGVRSG